VKDVIPFVEKRFRVVAAKDDRAIAGLSMGGGHTLAATNNNPGTFAYIGVFSSGPQVVDETFQKQLEAVKAGGVKFYWLGAGTTDMARERTVTLSEFVKREGFNTTYREIPGRHYWFLWRDFSCTTRRSRSCRLRSRKDLACRAGLTRPRAWPASRRRVRHSCGVSD